MDSNEHLGLPAPSGSRDATDKEQGVATTPLDEKKVIKPSGKLHWKQNLKGKLPPDLQEMLNKKGITD